MKIKELRAELLNKKQDDQVVVVDPDAQEQEYREIENVAYVAELNKYVIWLKPR